MAMDARSNNESVVPVTGGAREMAVSPTGKEVAFIVPRRGVRHQRRRRRHQAHHQHAGTGTRRRVSRPTARPSSTPRSATAAGRSTKRAARATTSRTSTRPRVLKETPLIANAQGRTTQPAVLARRQGNRLRRGPLDPQDPQARDQGRAGRSSPTRTVLRRRRSVLPVEPRQQVDPLRLLGARLRAGRGGPGPGRRQGRARST